jgi:hypothetical protein
MHITDKTNLVTWLDALAESCTLIAPCQVEGELLYRPVASGREISLDFERTALSPKAFLLPETEILLQVERRGQAVDARRSGTAAAAGHLWHPALRRPRPARPRRPAAGPAPGRRRLRRAPRPDDARRPGLPPAVGGLLLHQPGRRPRRRHRRGPDALRRRRRVLAAGRDRQGRRAPGVAIRPGDRPACTGSALPERPRCRCCRPKDGQRFSTMPTGGDWPIAA